MAANILRAYRFRRLLNRSLMGGGLLIFFIIIIGPGLFLLSDLHRWIATGGNQDWWIAIPTGRRSGLFIRSLALAASVAVSGTLIGVLAGILLTTLRNGVNSWIRWLVLVFAAVPPYIHALAWNTAFLAFNGFLRLFALPEIPMYGWGICWWVLLMAHLPFAVGLAIMALESVEISLVDAARVMQPDLRVLRGILLPLAGPAIKAGAGILFLLSVMEFSVPSLFQNNVYSMEIFAEFSASYEPARAFLLRAEQNK
jgi:iron(III) transport system permease protein